jgi:hypothetical protein
MDTIDSFLTLEETVNFSPFIMMLAIGLYKQPLLYCGTFFLFLVSSELLLWKNVEFCQFFSVSIEIITWVLSLFLLKCCITFNDLCILNQPWILRMKWTWYVVEFSFSLFYWGFCKISSFKRFIIILFLVVSLSSFVTSVILLHRMSLIVFLPFLFHGKVWGVLILLLAYRSARIQHWNHQVLDFSFLGDSIAASINCL